MGKKKTVTEQKNTYEHIAPVMTPEKQKVLDFKAATTDPTIPFHYAAQRQELENSYNNPNGSYTTPAVREALQRSAGQRLGMDEASAIQASQFNADNTNYNRALNASSLTDPQLVQSGGTSTQTQSGGFWGDLAKSLIGNAAQAGMAVATGGASLPMTALGSGFSLPSSGLTGLHEAGNSFAGGIA